MLTDANGANQRLTGWPTVSGGGDGAYALPFSVEWAYTSCKTSRFLCAFLPYQRSFASISLNGLGWLSRLVRCRKTTRFPSAR